MSTHIPAIFADTTSLAFREEVIIRFQLNPRPSIHKLVALGISEAMLNRWWSRFGAMTTSEAKELQRLREENTRLKRLLEQVELETAVWKEII